MSKLDVTKSRELLQAFKFHRLFIEQLGWSQPQRSRPLPITVNDAAFTLREIAQLGATVFEVEAPDGTIPDAATRLAVQREVAKQHHENLLIFIDRDREQSLWQWARREGGALRPRDHYFNRGQTGDLFLSKLAGLVVELTELDAEGEIGVADIAQRLRRALDVERVTKRFYKEYETQHLAFLEEIQGITDERDRRWYASILLNRMMFVYFLQKKGFLDRGDHSYLRNLLAKSRATGPDRYYGDSLRLLFFEGLAKPEKERSAAARAALGEVCYLDGGLFLEHRIELENPAIEIPDRAFENLLDLFDRYSWSLDDTPGGKDDEINPDVLGYIFEKYINQKAFGAYYTRPEITDYLCEQTLYRLILDGVSSAEIPGVAPARRFESLEELLLRLDGSLCRKLLLEVLPGLTILDPACGSGAFLVAALKALTNVYSAVVGRIGFVNDPRLRDWLRKANAEHPSLHYFIKKSIVTRNLFGVDLMEEATEITKLRLFLALVASARTVDELEPLPNIDFNILAGNALIGLLHVDDAAFASHAGQGNIFTQSDYRQQVADKNRLIESFRGGARAFGDELRLLRDAIDKERASARETLDAVLLDEFQAHRIRFEQATWDDRGNRPGKPNRRPVCLEDLRALHPFHWGYEFDQVLARGGFDAILTNPPWEAWKPQAKEFFAEHSGLVTKNKMTIKEFEKEQAKLLRDPEIREAWLTYLSRFPHVSLYFRSAAQYRNQIARVKTQDGKERKAGSDVNLYKLFLEQCFNLLRPGGRCGILLPTGVYTDLGTKQLREMLFTQARIQALFGLSNERFLFEGVDHRFRICLLTFEKGRETDEFEAAFRIDPREAIATDRLESFLHNRGEHVTLSVELVRRLSPDSVSLMEFKTELDIEIAARMLRFPLLGVRLEKTWNLRIVDEFHIRNHSAAFLTSPGPGLLPLLTGRMFHQFELTDQHSGYWIREEDGKRRTRNDQYKSYRWVYRRIARTTDQRTMISTIAPRLVFTEVNSPTLDSSLIALPEMLILCGIANSFAFDWLLRHRVDDTLNKFLLYQMPVPRITAKGKASNPIVARVARLVCRSDDFGELWEQVMPTAWAPENGAIDAEERARLRAELDGLVAHLYGLAEEEFAHVLSTFPVVPQATKDAALAAYRELAPKTADAELAALLLGGEGPLVEFKSTLRWDLKENRKNPDLEKVVVKTVAGFLNADGGTLLLGVADDGTPVGLERDYASLSKSNRDGFELHLTNLLLDRLGRDLTPCVECHFHQIEESDVCRVEIRPSPRPVVVVEGNAQAFYLRTGNSTRQLSVTEILAYQKQRWRNGAAG
jgi:hypothetical protein